MQIHYDPSFVESKAGTCFRSMLHDILDRVDLYCTACRTFDGTIVQHKLNLVPGETSQDFVLGGFLECPSCRKRYPIVDGVPCFIDGVYQSGDIISQYLDAQYGTLNRDYWQQMDILKSSGLHLDAGCSVGRYTFERGRHGLSIGLDADLESLKLAAGFQRSGKIEYTRKTRTLTSEREISDFLPSRDVFFVLADLHNPPFKMDTFTTISGLNLIDSVKYPLTVIGQLDALLIPGGELLFSSPYCWSPEISQHWLETTETDPHSFLIRLMRGDIMPECQFQYELLSEKTGIPWIIRKQDTLLFNYMVDTLLFRKC